MNTLEKEMTKSERILMMLEAEADLIAEQKCADYKDSDNDSDELKALKDELLILMDARLELGEQKSVCKSPEACARWEARCDLIKKQIAQVEDEICKLDETSGKDE